MPSLPVIPETITVHLGPPASAAENVTVSFSDYIKNVASSEIYPTWPENALRANIYAQISFALNRIYTEFYRSRGYDFDITNSTATDQYFVKGRDIFENIGQLVDELFNDYVVRQGSVEPLFTQYCNGTTVTCPGLSQWGTVSLARQGYTPYEILQYYYGDDINIVQNAPVREVEESYPGRPFSLGEQGNDVRRLQVRLNRISTNYPSIPKIQPVNGIFDSDTEAAVRAFQKAFSLSQDGVVGKSTWYAIARIYNAVKRLNELNSEGLALSDIELIFPAYIGPGSEGNYVRAIQFYLSYIAQYEEAVNPVPLTGIYGSQTEEAVRAFQEAYDLPVDGIVGRETYNKLLDVYRGIVATLPPSLFVNRARPYPGEQLLVGSEGEEVRYLQQYINTIAEVFPSVPSVTVDGSFGPATDRAVRAIQSLIGVPQNGIVGAVTWNQIAILYDDIRAGTFVQGGQYPGYAIGGSV